MDTMAEKTLPSVRANERAIAVVVAVRPTLLREGVRLILASAPGIDVVGMMSPGPEIDPLLRRLQPDVVVLDIDLVEPERSVRDMMAQAPGSRILLLAANEEIQPLLALFQAGARGCLSVDATGQELIAAVRQVNRDEMVLGPAVARQIVDQVAERPPAADDTHTVQEILTDREEEVLDLLCQGLTDKQIAQKLYISVRTVNSHLGHLYAKLGVHSRTEAMHLVMEKGWISLVSVKTSLPTGKVMQG